MNKHKKDPATEKSSVIRYVSRNIFQALAISGTIIVAFVTVYVWGWGVYVLIWIFCIVLILVLIYYHSENRRLLTENLGLGKERDESLKEKELLRGKFEQQSNEVASLSKSLKELREKHDGLVKEHQKTLSKIDTLTKEIEMEREKAVSLETDLRLETEKVQELESEMQNLLTAESRPYITVIHRKHHRLIRPDLYFVTLTNTGGGEARNIDVKIRFYSKSKDRSEPQSYHYELLKPGTPIQIPLGELKLYREWETILVRLRYEDTAEREYTRDVNYAVPS